MFLKNISVFAVGDEYHIMSQANGNSVMTVKIGEELYGDESNGVLRSDVKIHRVAVPRAVLDAAGEYTVTEQLVIERSPYFPRLGESCTKTIRFFPVPQSREVRAYHISDAHNRVESVIAAARQFGKIDFLIMNGDIPEDSGSVENFENFYKIAHRLTNGSYPIVYSRGNHDMRGILAERIIDFTPNRNGNSYYTFRLGGIWGAVLDCGEDKPDSHPEYNGTVCCRAFRKRQTEFLKSIISSAESEYAAADVEHKIIVVHAPFPCINRKEPPFLNETELYAEWTRLIAEIKPDFMLSGHEHRLEVVRNGDNPLDGELPFPVIIAAQPLKDGFSGCGLVFGAQKGNIDIVFTNDKDGIISTDTLKKGE